MRVLVATTAGSGHFGPLIPFARAVQKGGHQVVVAAPASFATAVEGAGFTHAPFDDVPAEEIEEVTAKLPGLPDNDARSTLVVSEIFGRLDTTYALPKVEALVSDWQPDLVLRESTEFSSYLAARAAGLPHVHVVIGLSSFGDFARPALEAVLTELGAEPGLHSLLSAPSVSLAPPSLDGPVPGTYDRLLRFREERNGDPQPLPDWWDGPPDPLVYVTFGSVAADFGFYPELYRRAMGAVSELPVRVLLTIGSGADPAALGHVPPNVHVEPWWPQQAVMPHAAAMVAHGGFGTTLQALAWGVPMVVLPLFADQPDNARRVEAVGAGIALEGGPANVERLAGAVQRLLEDPRFRNAAGAIADDIATLPPVSQVVPFFQTLVR